MPLTLPPHEAEKVADMLWYRNPDNTVTAVVQEAGTGKVLMVASMNRDAVIKTLTTGIAHYWSRSRRKLWMKGETSGNIQLVEKFYIDCDGDSVLLVVKQVGAACHTGMHSCFHRVVTREGVVLDEEAPQH